MNTKRFSSKKKNFNIYYFLPIITFIALVSLIAFKNFLYYQPYQDSSMDGSEVVEEKQNTIPPDVSSFITQQKINRTVLGASTDHISSFRVPILMYHYVENIKNYKDTQRIKLNTPPNILENQIQTLTQAGYICLSMSELDAILHNHQPIPDKPIILTFDDGYYDFYTDAYPILKKYNFKATQYVIAGFIDKPNHLTMEQLLELSKDNLIEIGSHTVHHTWLKGINTQSASSEILQSKQVLENLIHKPITTFAYPFGAFDLQAMQLVQNAGYQTAVSTIPGDVHSTDTILFLYRLRPGSRTGAEFLTWLESQ